MQKMLAQNWDAPVVFTTMVQFWKRCLGEEQEASAECTN
jgi:hypothetical protein